MRRWHWVITTAAVIAIGRLGAIGYYQWTGEKVIPEIFIVSGFWLQFLVFGLGLHMRYLDRRRHHQRGFGNR